MEFSPNNNIVKHCLQGMHMEEKDDLQAARQLYLQAWHEATNELEKFIAAYFIARQQTNIADKLTWFQSAEKAALKMKDADILSIFHSLYINIAECYEGLNDSSEAKKYRDYAASYKNNITDKGPFYHGTKADLQIGDLLTAGGNSNYKEGLQMNHIYFTAQLNGAGLAASLAKGNGQEHVYMVEPTGSFENDPNVTDKKFPGNLTRSYRSQSPLKIIGEINNWEQQTPMQLKEWKERLNNNKGDIIN